MIVLMDDYPNHSCTQRVIAHYVTHTYPNQPIGSMARTVFEINPKTTQL